MTYREMRIVSLLLVCAIAVNLIGCVVNVQAEDLMKDITPNVVTALDDLTDRNGDITDFAVRLFKAIGAGEGNTLISPLSVLCALAMTANGAEQETKGQMETVLGMTTDELNLYLYSYINSLPQEKKYKLSIANSIWFKENENLAVSQDFLQTNADYYGASIYKAPFDSRTCKDINNWVKKNTDKMIPRIVENIPADAVMYLINALAFEAEWVETYRYNQVRDGEFTKEDGTKQSADFMYSIEAAYLSDGKATGFIKYYKDKKYAFVAMLPNEGISVSDYIATLDGETLNALLGNFEYAYVSTAIPKFETEYDVEMSEILKGMGMTEAFDPDNADFEGIGTVAGGNICINKVVHKTFISVGEKGTKAGAATSVEMGSGGAGSEKKVYLNRPFVYMLVDCQNNIPFFAGTMMDIES